MIKLKDRMIAALIVYLILLLLLFVFQRKIQYLPLGKTRDVASYNLKGFTAEILTTDDDINILSWYKKPSNNNNKIILYFHGNAGNLGDRSHKFATFSKGGFGIMGVSYRGYSGSDGSPSESGLMLDAKAALAFLLKEGYTTNNIILYGESLGSGVVMKLAKEHNFASLILESPFSSIISVAKRSYWFVPVSLMLKDRFESIKYAHKVRSPVLIIHGLKDRVVPYEEGLNLYNAIIAKKKMVSVESAGHLEFDDIFLLKEIKEFLEKEA